MILGVGLDICESVRFDGKVPDDSFVRRFFHPRELSGLADRKIGISESLAARFAAKEAFGKAMGTGIGKYSLQDIYTLSKENGKPELMVEGAALEDFRRLGGKAIHLSLSHDKGMAAAVVILEGKDCG